MASRPQGAADQVVDAVDRDVVEHDGVDDFVHAARRLEPARDASPERTEAASDDSSEREVDEPREAQVERTDPGGAGCPHIQLSLTADVEKAGAKGPVRSRGTVLTRVLEKLTRFPTEP